MDKAMLPDRMMTMLGLKLHKRMKTEDNDVTLLKNEEHGLRIACFTVLPELALIGSCSLATVLQPETTP
ncbi:MULTISPECIES: hypothetical protein [Methylobacterium]|uniref:hypothetical protein n=1 Tax=Methylobacterium TaxID=407 RepID=UPI0013EB62D4|nr:hypothetical protein [Methylobacterium sp. DB0501]NGM38234.1 hypothetical protein [Methylobacterium sp. DB0501]